MDSWGGQNLYKTNFWCIIWIARMTSFHLIYNFRLKKLFEKVCTKILKSVFGKNDASQICKKKP